MMRSILGLFVIAVSAHFSHGSDSINVSPSSGLESVGTVFAFSCTITPAVDAETGLKWTFERTGEPMRVTLSTSARHQISSSSDTDKTTSILTINGLEEEDSGVYYCSDMTDMNQHQATLKVYEAPKIQMVSNPAEPVIDPKRPSNITLHCATNGLTVIWEKNGVPVGELGIHDLDGDEDVDVEVKVNNTLVILNSELSDTGVYDCIVTHEAHGQQIFEKQSKEVTAHLTMKLPQSVNLEEGENARIPCEVSSFPPPSVIWFRGSELLSNGSNDGHIWIMETPPGSPQLVSTLMIKKVVDADRDLYTCNATNAAMEKVSKECLLRVKDRMAALWPFIGIMCEVILLVAIILLCERRQKAKMMRAEMEDIPEAKKLNDNSNTNESDIRLRNINA